jgi:glycosyltransferase involved in cell wall biosynthesis
VCIPTYSRPVFLARALTSVVANGTVDPQRVEIVVADNAAAIGEPVAAPLLASWPGPTAYLGGPENVGMVANFNRCISGSSGQAVLIVHDDDRLLPGAIDAILAALDAAPADRPVQLFGTHVVAGDGRILRRQVWERRRFLPPEAAVRRVLTNSSMVRFPSVVVDRAAYEAVGAFREQFGGADDLDMWLRLFSRYGVTLQPAAVSAYTIHPGADTESMFDARTIGYLQELFAEARALDLLDDETLEHARNDYFHQFILGGTYRRLLAGDRAGARTVMSLFEQPSLDDLGPSRRWGPVRGAMRLLIQLPAAAWTLMALLARRLETRTRSWL